MHWCLWGDDDIGEIGIGNMLGEIVVVGFMKSWMEIENGKWNDFSSWIRKSSKENIKGEVNRIWIHVCLFKLLNICVTILMIFMFQ
jgi:hypothetical protein